MELGYKPPREEASRQWVGGVTQMQLKSRRTPEKPQENGKGDGARLGADIKFYRPGDKEPFMNEQLQAEILSLALFHERLFVARSIKFDIRPKARSIALAVLLGLFRRSAAF